MNVVWIIIMFIAFWGAIGGLAWFFGDRQGDVHQFHLPPYRTRRDDD